MDGEKFYVQCMNAEGNLGRLFGPGDWSACVAKVFALVRKRKRMTPKQAQQVRECGSFVFRGGDSIHIVLGFPLEKE